ncbi:hypothetical protein [Pseudooceanicola sp. HF7]|uniref:hypothetical protein n=1 Tax=Pseudooceanicola sp. HF7 TaxID=2721560 RepID=UPI001430BF61|nr:hypothetical protein [Pseudooceanicola sp. HF7]NIZ09643.1 hypothetical protein [Pseudooceanicola sp. HF7]
MIAWQLFRHSVSLVFRNFSQALRIYLLPLLILGALTVLFMWSDLSFLMQLNTDFVDGDLVPGFSAGFLGKLGLLVLIGVVVMMWLAVAWHRFVLLEEKPDKLLPRFNGAQIWAYFKAAVLLWLVGVVLSVGFMLIIALFAALISGGTAAMVLMIAIVVVVCLAAAVLMLRIAITLPAAAIGQPLSLRQAMAGTRNAGGTLLLLVILIGVVSAVLQIPAEWFLATGSMTAYVAYSVVLQFLSTIVGVSILTTLYGYYIEERRLG